MWSQFASYGGYMLENISITTRKKQYMLLFLWTFYFKNRQINLASNYLKKADSDTVHF